MAPDTGPQLYILLTKQSARRTALCRDAPSAARLVFRGPGEQAVTGRGRASPADREHLNTSELAKRQVDMLEMTQGLNARRTLHAELR